MANRYRWRFMALALVLAMAFLPIRPALAEPAIAEPFRDYYAEHRGLRVLGNPLTPLLQVDGHPAQYFEKGRIEDHGADAVDPAWRFMYGRLTAELISRAPQKHVNATNITYDDLGRAASPALRRAPPPSFTGGTMATRDGIFVPYDPQLRVASGYVVPLYFWTYLQRTELFPGGWLHDVGLPMTDAFVVEANKNGEYRRIMTQAFERAVLTYDPLNPPAWQVERGNIGADAVGTVSQPAVLELPEPGSRVVLPLPILARVGNPGEQMTAVLRWENGVELRRTLTTLRGEDGRGLLVTNLDWRTESRPPQPPDRGARLEIRGPRGELLAERELEVLRWDDPQTRTVDVYWLIGERLQRVERRIPRTIRPATASLEELLWGPRPGNLAGFSTAIPEPEEVLRYTGRGPDWGPRVTLRKVTIDNGVATADFSQELRAYGGGAARAQLIRSQINRTLLQFPTVSEVRILIEGQSDSVLEP